MFLSVIIIWISFISFQSLAQFGCKKEPCINLCCPHGHAFRDDLDALLEKRHRCDSEPGIEKKCQKHPEEDLKWEGNWWENGTKVSKVRKENLFGDTFKCPDNKNEVASDNLFGSHQMKLQRNGSHQVVIQTQEGKEMLLTTLGTSEFCLSFTESYYSDDSSISPMFLVCYGHKKEEAEQFTNTFYPVIIFISCFFTFLTLIVYITLEDLRCNLFGKLVLGFLTNVCLNYFFNGIHYSLDIQEQKDYLNTTFCVLLGYITHHTFISFFFWMNAMAMNITYKFSNILTTVQEENQKRSLAGMILYAQGIPLLITITLAFIDGYGSCDSILPNMGRYSCFVGSQYTDTQAFTRTSQFLYYYLIILIIVISNTFSFVITGYFLTRNWSTVRNMQTSNQDDTILAHVMLVTKLFIIMGIPWILDVISAALAHSKSHSKTVWTQLLLDIVNLLTGVLIFLILICKKTVLEKLRRKLSLGETSSETFEEVITLDKQNSTEIQK